ncbi:MAG: HAD family phosphatase [Clostridia bacterium]|nr:HAD family phosphatase [Clostridia bacterium]
MAEYRLAALDMDGTLLNADHVTTPYTREVIERAAAAGKIVALSTGRALSELWTHLRQIPGIAYVIGESGACIYDVRQDRILHKITLDDDDVDAIFTAAEGMDVTVQCFIDNQSYMTGESDEAMAAHHVTAFAAAFRAGSKFIDDAAALCRASRGRVSKVNLYFADAAERARYPERIRCLNVALKDSVGIGWEISPPEADKAKGLRFLCDHLGLSPRQVMAVGDGGNDLDIMGAAGLSVAMGNAIDAVKAMADALTDDCDHDGAAKAIERYMLGVEGLGIRN